MRSQSCYREYSFHSVTFCCIEINKDPFEEGVVLMRSKNGVIMYFHSNAIQLGRAPFDWAKCVTLALFLTPSPLSHS